MPCNQPGVALLTFCNVGVNCHYPMIVNVELFLESTESQVHYSMFSIVLPSASVLFSCGRGEFFDAHLSAIPVQLATDGVAKVY